MSNHTNKNSDSFQKIGCTIPCYKGGQITINLIKELHCYVDLIVLVDDGCPFKTGNLAKDYFKDSDKLHVIHNEFNKGLGFSVKRGFKFLIQKGCEVIVKIDADGQMKPELIPFLIKPIFANKSDAVKGNRFTSIDNIISMPKIRIARNLILTFLNKLSTGYWELSDPTNGFLAFNRISLEKVRLDKLDDKYFFESDLLFQCSLANIFFEQLPMKSVYGGEISSLNPLKQIIIFSKQHIVNFFKRIIYHYFVLDFNAGSLEIIGFLFFSFSTLITFFKIYFRGLSNNEFATPGEANLISILFLVSIQLLLGILYFDSTYQPLMRQIKRWR